MGTVPIFLTIRRGKRFWRQGEPFVWATGAALSAVLLATLLLMVVVMVHGLGVFWPSRITQATLADGRSIVGLRLRTAVNPDDGVESVQFKTGNRELDPQQMDFHWVRSDAICETTHPRDVYVLERTGNGDFYGFLEEVTAPTLAGEKGTGPIRAEPGTDRRLVAGRSGKLDPSPSSGLDDRFRAALAEVRRQRAKQVQPIADRLFALNHQLQDTQDAILKLEYQAKQAPDAIGDRPDSRGEARGNGTVPLGPPLGPDGDGIDARLAELRGEKARIGRASEQLVAEKRNLEAGLRENAARFRTASGEVHAIALLDVVRAYQPNAMSWLSKVGHYGAKVWELLADEPRESNTEGGLFPAIFGTVMLVFLMSALCFPLGVLAGVYLGEYAREGAMVRLVRIAVNNLAGIPSIVYGMFGLGFFVYGLGGLIDAWFFPERVAAGNPTFGTGGILWASMTLGLLTVPVVIVSTEEALRTIPRGFREGSYALGATKFQTLRRVLLPLASPGIMTGFILAMARAAGEVAPLMITGVVKLAPTLPVDGQSPFFHPDRKFMHLGYHIYDIAFQSPNVEATKPMVYVTTLLLVLIVLVMQSAAIYFRNRMKKRYQARMI